MVFTLMNAYKIICVGPYSGVKTGQSAAFRQSTCAFRDPVVVDVNAGSVLGFLTFLLNYLHTLVCVKSKVVYFTSSRSLPGFVRDFVIVFFGALKGCVLINHLHGNDFLEFKNRYSFARSLIDYIYDKIDVSIVLDIDMLRHYDQYPRMKRYVVPNFFLPFDFPYENRPVAKSIRILYFSNILYSKGVLDCIEACEMCCKAGVSVELKIAGEFLSDEHLTSEQIRNQVLHKISDNVQYVGPVFGQEKWKLLTWAHIMCLPTFYKTEAQPIAVIEALAAGCFVVSTSAGYIPKMLEGTFHELVDVQSPDQISHSLQRFRISEFTDISTRNKMIADQKFSVERYNSNLAGVVMDSVRDD